ncbi:TonB family protein [Halosquirtibacter xylanolyticus]|uniref:TonB family protein n=1 Tax=Halosquirtibacter xylanolyticus TaxID=3374599 RepID=UPI0037487B02|nr:TonB family protein [Prolixibacteraceae bacterium]
MSRKKAILALTLAIFAITSQCFAQKDTKKPTKIKYKVGDKTYFDFTCQKKVKPIMASFYRIITPREDKLVEVQTYNKATHQLISKSTGKLKSNKTLTLEGSYTAYYEDGKVKGEGTYKKNLKQGQWTWYRQDGTKSASEKYSNNKIKEAYYWDKNGEIASNENHPFTFELSIKYHKFIKREIRTNIYYPEEAWEKGIEGKVILSYDINEKGAIEDIEILQSADPLLDKEAIRVVKNFPKAEPFIEHNLPCRIHKVIHINFNLKKTRRAIKYTLNQPVYLNGIGKDQNDPSKSHMYRIITNKRDSLVDVTTYWCGTKAILSKNTAIYTKYNTLTFHGNYTEYYENGALMGKGEYKNGKKTGNWEWFRKDGTKASSETYQNNRQTHTTCFDKDGKTTRCMNEKEASKERVKKGSKTLLSSIEQNIKYPKTMWEQKIQGSVLVSFVLTVEGEITDLKVIKSPHPLLSVEAFRVLELAPKLPTRIAHNMPYPTFFTIPINFELN